MKSRHKAPLAALAATLVAVRPATLLATDRACPPIAILSDGEFRARYPDLLERIRSALSAPPDIDTCARVELRLLEGGIGVSVTLPDGRHAARQVARSEDVLPTLVALLLLPDQAPAAVTEPEPPAAAAVGLPRRPVPVSHADPNAGDVPAPPTRAARELGFELSVIGGARLGDGQFGYGVGVLSFLRLRRWLLGFEGRADGYRSIHGGGPESALELAILAGRRFDFDSVALDLTVGPGIALKGIALSETQAVPVTTMARVAPPPHSEPSSGPVPRLLLGARLGFSPRSVFRTFIGLDGEVGPARAELAPNVSSPRMPVFTVGLALGATVGTP